MSYAIWHCIAGFVESVRSIMCQNVTHFLPVHTSYKNFSLSKRSTFCIYSVCEVNTKHCLLRSLLQKIDTLLNTVWKIFHCGDNFVCMCVSIYTHTHSYIYIYIYNPFSLIIFISLFVTDFKPSFQV